MQGIDVFEKYYSFSKLDESSPYYPQKRENYLAAKELYFSNKSCLTSLPLRATIQTTDFCNLNCIMCQIHSHKENHTLMQMGKSDFDKIVERLFPTLVEVHPTNIGEPLMSAWFDYLVDKAVEYGVLFDLTTNGTLLTERKIRKMLPSLLDIKISFDGAKKETFESIRKGASFEKTLSNIREIVRLRNESGSKATITLQMTLSNINYKELPDLIRLAKELGVDKVKAYPVTSFSLETDSIVLVDNMENLVRILRQSTELAREIGMNVGLAEPPSKDPQKDIDRLVLQKCRLPWAECFIDFDGNVYPCHAHHKIAYGNISQNDAYDVWNGEYARQLRSSLLCGKTNNTICFNCGNNFIREDRSQSVPYNVDDYLFRKTGDDNINWGKRYTQFTLNR